MFCSRIPLRYPACDPPRLTPPRYPAIPPFHPPQATTHAREDKEARENKREKSSVFNLFGDEGETKIGDTGFNAAMRGGKSVGGSTAGGGLSSLPTGFSDDVFSLLNENLDEAEINREEVRRETHTCVRMRTVAPVRTRTETRVRQCPSLGAVSRSLRINPRAIFPTPAHLATTPPCQMIRQKHKLASAEASIESLTETVNELKGMLTQLLTANNIVPKGNPRQNLPRRSLQLKMVGKWLDRPNKDARTTTDPYLRLVRPKLDPSWAHDESFWVSDLSVIWQSDVKRKSLMPDWAETVIDLDDLGGHGLAEEEELVIQVFDWNRAPPHDVIGTQRISIGSLLDGEPKSLTLFNTTMGTSRSGLVMIMKAKVVVSSELKSRTRVGMGIHHNMGV